MNILALILARGGSKGIPHKNIVPLLGRPLLAYSCEAALTSSQFSRIIVSTDDLRIAEVAKNNGAEVPFIRPSSLSDDFTNTIDVLRHAS